MSTSRYYPRISRVILTNDWYAGGWSTGTVLAYDNFNQSINPQGPTSNPNGDPNYGFYTLTLYDPGKVIEGTLFEAAQYSVTGGWYLPMGTECQVYQPEDAADGHWELINAGIVEEGSFFFGLELGSQIEGSEFGSEFEEGTEEGTHVGTHEGSEEGSEEGTHEGSEGPCITPTDMGWPNPPDGGDYVPMVSGFCVQYTPVSSCESSGGNQMEAMMREIRELRMRIAKLEAGAK